MTTKSLCPACLGIFRTSKTGQMMRHGFSAKNVRHGANTGWHTGACPGTGHDPIGTDKGNAFALRIAAQQDEHAAKQEAAPAFTQGDAIALAVAEARLGMNKRNAFRPQPLATFTTLEEFRAHPSFISYSGWFSQGALAQRMARMERQRQEDAAARRAHAAALREAVAANPATARAA